MSQIDSLDSENSEKLQSSKIVESKNTESLDLESDNTDIKVFISNSDFIISSKEAEISEFFKTLLLSEPESDGFIHCELSNITMDIFENIYKYIKHYNGIPQEIVAKPLRSNDFKECVNNEWDFEYIKNFKNMDLSKMASACNYLNIQCLMHLCLSRVASNIRGKNETEMRYELENN